MSSYTVVITGNTSTLRTTLFPALRLHRHKSYEIALLDFTTYNSIPNVTEGTNNILHYYETAGDKQKGLVKEVSLITGLYEIDDINEAIQKSLGKENFTLSANENILRVEVTSKYFLDFTKPKSIGSLFGFPSSGEILTPDTLHTAPDIVNINVVNTINVTCNIAEGSYKDGGRNHILHSFYPTVSAGFKIVERPHNLVYLPLTTSYISDIVVNVCDQHGSTIDFRGEPISLRLHIKQT